MDQRPDGFKSKSYVRESLLISAGGNAVGIQGYVVGVGAAILAALVAWPFARTHDPLLLIVLLPAIAGVTFYAGMRPAMLTAILGAALFFISLPHDGHVASQSTMALAFCAYVVAAAVQIALIHMAKLSVIRERVATREMTAQLDAQRTRFQELQHRIGNHMQSVAGLLALQRAKVRSDPTCALSAFEDARERVVNMARVHRRFHEPVGVGKGLQQHLQELCTDLVSSSSQHRVVCFVDSEVSIDDPIRLMTLSLLIGEAITNSLKHAFPGDEIGTISVALKVQGNGHELTIRDNGRGLPQSFNPLAGPSLGFKIMQSLASQLGGKLEVIAGHGPIIRVAFD